LKSQILIVGSLMKIFWLAVFQNGDILIGCYLKDETQAVRIKQDFKRGIINLEQNK